VRNRKRRMPSCDVVAPLRCKRGSVVDAVDVNRRNRTTKRRRVRVGRDTGRLRIGGKKAIAGAKSRPWRSLSKFFAWQKELAVT